MTQKRHSEASEALILDGHWIPAVWGLYTTKSKHFELVPPDLVPKTNQSGLWWNCFWFWCSDWKNTKPADIVRALAPLLHYNYLSLHISFAVLPSHRLDDDTRRWGGGCKKSDDKIRSLDMLCVWDSGEYQAQRSVIMMARMQQVREEPTWDS